MFIIEYPVFFNLVRMDISNGVIKLEIINEKSSIATISFESSHLIL